jgi:hypothetical protein
MSDNLVPCSTWRALSRQEEQEFRFHARSNYKAGSPVNVIWHPVYLHECYLINKEQGLLPP